MTTKTKLPVCISAKRVWVTEEDAQTELDRILEKAPQRPERRYYECPLCNYFHLTKQDKRNPREGMRRKR